MSRGLITAVMLIVAAVAVIYVGYVGYGNLIDRVVSKIKADEAKMEERSAALDKAFDACVAGQPIGMDLDARRAACGRTWTIGVVESK